MNFNKEATRSSHTHTHIKPRICVLFEEGYSCVPCDKLFYRSLLYDEFLKRMYYLLPFIFCTCHILDLLDFFCYFVSYGSCGELDKQHIVLWLGFVALKDMTPCFSSFVGIPYSMINIFKCLSVAHL